MKNTAAIILAAGRGTRMKSPLPKVLQEVHSRPFLSFVIRNVREAGVKKIVLVVGYRGDLVRKTFSDVDAVTQKKLLGSGDAVKKAKAYFSRFRGDILVLYGDTPFIRAGTIRSLVKKHKKEKASCTLLTARIKDPSEYGRIVRDAQGAVVRIVEDRDTSLHEKVIKEINVGCYCFNRKSLFEELKNVTLNRRKGEYYLTDIVEMIAKKKKIATVLCKDPVEVMGINSKCDLADANALMQKRVLNTLMSRGVTITDPGSICVDMDAKIGAGTVIYPHTVIEGKTVIGRDCRIGPFARIRGGTFIKDEVEIGNFVELVRTRVSSGTKIKHLSYLGDAIIGTQVNIGAGTITANYDGKKKSRTIIADGASIGVGAILVAPVKVGRGALVGAGCVVTKHKDVPPGRTVVGVPARVLPDRKKEGDS
jgi:bifunctional UDP-N-acetylglucosamine pyrophosphorylase/glucosamine-1-phosphate N-acetyltransferase